MLGMSGADAVIVFRPSYAPETKGNILILRENLPHGISPENYNLTVLSAEADRASAVMGNCCPSARTRTRREGRGTSELRCSRRAEF